MRELIFVGSHLGYPMDRTPLGGGAMVGLQLARAWAASGARLLVLGSGPQPPWAAGATAARYAQLPEGAGDPGLIGLSERGYARFCRSFEAATTAFLLAPGAFEPKRTTVVVNDISESPDLERLAAAGFRIVSIWHVDVVDYFNRMYLGGVLPPERLTRAFARAADWGLGRAVPDLLRLVFEKQAAAVRRSDSVIVPSRRMAETIVRCYGQRARVRVVPWGGWAEPCPEEEVRARAARLREHYQVGPETRVLATLSRISPEKGLHVLLDALRRLEAEAPQIADLCLLVCGEPAFMRGQAYARRVRAAAERLRRFRVFFPGYLAGVEKRSTLRLVDLFLSPSVHESYGLTLVEALQAGLPVLAADHHGAGEILRPEFGRVVPDGGGGSAGRFSAALRELLLGGRLQAMGRAAREAAAAMTFDRAADAVRAEAEA